MDQRNASFGTDRGDIFRSDRIDEMGGFAIRFGLVDRRIGRAIDNNAAACNRLPDRQPVRNIAFGSSERAVNDVPSTGLVGKRSPDLSLRTENEKGRHDGGPPVREHLILPHSRNDGATSAILPPPTTPTDTAPTVIAQSG